MEKVDGLRQDFFWEPWNGVEVFLSSCKLAATLVSNQAKEQAPKSSTTSAEVEADRALVQRILQGERGVFQEMYRTYAPHLLKRILRLTGDYAQAEDCLQQVFTDVLQNLHYYRGEGRLHAWLNKITTNTVLQLFRREQRRQSFVSEFLAEHFQRPPSSTPLPERLFHEEHLQELVHDALRKLSFRKRMVILLCDLEGRKLEDVAQELGVSKGTVASRLHHGRRELRERITAEVKRSDSSIEELFYDG